MSETLIDGGGKGYQAGVNSENRLKTLSVTSSAEHHANHHDKTAYSLLFDATPTGAADCFLYIKNTDSTDMIVEGFGLKLIANEYIDVKIGDTGTPAGGGAIVPANLNGGTSATATGTFEDGNNITALSGGTTVYRIYHASSNGTTDYNFEQDIILPTNSTLTMYCQTGTTALAGYIDFNYHDVE